MKFRKASSENNLLKAYNMMLYFAGTMVMWDPEHECIHDFWKEGIIKSLPVSSSNPRFMKAASQLRESVNDAKSGFDSMKNDFISLFRNHGNAFTPPTESGFKLKYDHTTDAKAQTVSSFYRSYGWQSKFKDSIPDDHIGIELLFLTLMVEKYLELDDEACHTEMRNEIKRFINFHLLTWVPDWNEKIQENAVTLSYKGISSLILSCIEDMYAIMDGRNCIGTDLLKN